MEAVKHMQRLTTVNGKDREPQLDKTAKQKRSMPQSPPRLFSGAGQAEGR